MNNKTLDAGRDAAALMHAVLTQDRDALRVILAHADHAALVVELADFTASVMLYALGGDQDEAVKAIRLWQDNLNTRMEPDP